MFNTGYSFKLHHRTISDCPGNLRTIYRFELESGIRYLIELDHFDDDIFVVKFRLRSSKGKNRYGYLADVGIREASRIIRTSIDVCLAIKRDFPKASFGFLGERKIAKNGRIMEGIQETQRFRIYTMLCVSMFSEENYLHVDRKNQSAYLMVSKLNENPEKLARKTSDYFDENFEWT